MTFKVKDFGRKDYIEVYDLMRNFTLNRNISTEDEIWLVEHHSVYTLGLSKRIEHIIDAGNIPVVAPPDCEISIIIIYEYNICRFFHLLY